VSRKKGPARRGGGARASSKTPPAAGKTKAPPAKKKGAAKRPAARPAKRAAKRARKPRRPLFLRLINWGLAAFLWGFIALGGLLAWYAYDLPDIDRLAPAAVQPGVRLVAADGATVAHFGALRADPVQVRELPAHLPQAVIATEDRRFYQHFGIDWRGIARAAWVNLRAGRIVQGGSTLTQQLAKNLFLTPERSIGRKVQEALLALMLEHRFTKDQILTLYLNRVYLGAGAFGVEAAAQNYFGKSARAVSLAEAAMLAGLLKAPSRYAPTRDLDRAQGRAGIVLAAMVREGYATAAQADAARRAPARLRRTRGTGGRYFADWVMARIGGFVSPDAGDITVVTTLDSRLQALAEKTVAARLAGEGATRGAAQAALVVLDPDGAVKAMVGGRDYGRSQFNRAVQARRQPGSAFKPFVYLGAVEKAGLTPETLVVDAPVRIGNWRPRNYADRYMGEVSAETALAQSLNSAAVRLAREVGLGTVINTARRLGITSPLRREAGLALGASEVSLLELASAYGAFANDGTGVWAFGVREIRDAAGKVVFRRLPSGPGRVVGGTALGHMNKMLAAVVDSGTGRAARIGRPAAGKTGTNENFRDAWFVGYTADLIAGVWVGNDDGAPMKGVTGGGLPARIWRDFMAAAHDGLPPRPLPGGRRSFLDRLFGG